ncbi:hypothetical protein ACHHYP_04582 [Achlya hypogyna]|uniref:RING-type domain-containing protein n=1 Tax=Achlya hypogyna TaxID=1202772 RepID=A0A1V9Z0T2_ACHHY|nr:hypothetical protein ACHHYP_04582 [Achlya hypogyna]
MVDLLVSEHQIVVDADTTTDRYGNTYCRYNIQLICPVLHEWWAIHSRYRTIRAFRDRLGTIRRVLRERKTGVYYADLLDSVLDTCRFPPRVWFRNADTTKERILGFQGFFYHLLQARLHLMPRTNSDSIVTELIHCVKSFLRTPDHLDYDENNVLAEANAPSPDETLIPVGVPLSEAPDMATLFNNDCTICLVAFSANEFQTAGQIVKTSCDHLFHATCIDSWIGMAKTTCPLCRKDIHHVTGLYNDE